MEEGEEYLVDEDDGTEEEIQQSQHSNTEPQSAGGEGERQSRRMTV